jgi:hypothetical protein
MSKVFYLLYTQFKMENTRTEAQNVPKNHRKKRGKRLLLILIVLLLAALGGGGWWYFSNSSTGIPKKIVHSVNFPVYYPSPLPAGYSYEKGSAKVSGSLLVYNLQSGSMRISVTEQAAPAHPPSLSDLPNFKSIDTLAGQAVIGSDRGIPVGILISNTTIVNLRTSNEVPNDVLGKVVQAMSSLPQ